MTIIVHHLENSRSQRILWMLEELGLPMRSNATSAIRRRCWPRELRAVHPLGKSPVIEDDGLVIAETGAIIEYLVGKGDGRLGPPAHREAMQRWRFWLHYAEGSLMPPLFVTLVLSRIPVMGKVAMKRFQPMFDRHLDYVESELARSPWFAGEQMTAADIIMSFPLEAARSRAGLDERRPATIAWLERIHARPTYQAALARADPMPMREA